MWNDKSLSNLLYFPNFWLCHWQITPLSFWKHPVVIVETFKVKSILQFQGIFLHNPFAQSWCLHLLGNFLVACICAWRHFLGVQLYSKYNIGCQNFERVQAIWSNLFLLIYCVVNLISESASQGEGCCIIVRDQYLSSGSTAALNCFLTQNHKRMFPEWQEVEVKRDIKVQGKVQMKMIISKQDKVKRLLLLQNNT